MEEKGYIKVFKSGRRLWNKWQEKINGVPFSNNRPVIIKRHDFSDMNLYGFDFCGYDLRGVVFSNSNLQSAQFNSVIRKESPIVTVLAGTIFNNSNLKYSNFNFTFCVDCDFSDAKFDLATFAKTYVVDSNFAGSFLRGTSFVKTEFKNCSFLNATFDDTFLIDVDLSSCKGFSNTNHLNPCLISENTVKMSMGTINSSFLSKSGADSSLIELAKNTFENVN